jgi:arsenate reductase
MREIGIDISSHRSKAVEDFLKLPFDYVITVCDSAKESCPVFHSARAKLHWRFEDPAAVQGPDEIRMEAFRKIRGQIAEKVRAFVKEMK